MIPLYPLAGVNPRDPLQGGYSFLDKTDGGATFHPGWDLNAGNGANADRGYDVVAVAPGIVRFNGYSAGYGHHLWIEHPNGDFSNHCHLDGPAFPQVGDPVERRQHVGECGGSGGPWLCHLHFEATVRRPLTWDQWPRNWPASSVRAFYHDPAVWLEHIAPAIARPHPLDEPFSSPPPQEGDEEMALTDQEREMVALVREHGVTKAVLDTYFARAAELGRELRDTKKHKVTRIREIGRELAAFA
ncbi:MAG TPA: M23 family metallopeptidase [Rhodothermales bacterium]|nr:M23 family metallopeptidase [Rhodothermales bacterium]